MDEIYSSFKSLSFWSLSHQDVYISVLVSSTGVRQKQELQSQCLQNKRHNHRKLIKIKIHRIMTQIKEQDKFPENQLNYMETSNLPEKGFRIMIVKMIQDLRKRMEAKIEKV